MDTPKAQEPTSAARPSTLRKAVRRIGPFAVSAAILYAYLHNLDWAQLRSIAARVHLPLAVAAVVLPQLINWYFGALVIQRTMEWFHGPFSLRRFFWLRGSAYILAFVNSALGGGGQLLYQQRRAQVS